MFYTDSENVPPAVHSVLDSMSECLGMKVSDMMCKLVKSLDKATAGSRHNPVDIEDGDPMVIDSDPEPELSDDPHDYDSDPGAWYPKSPKHQWNSALHVRAEDRAETLKLNSRIRHDLRMAKDAGFRVGHLGTLLNGGRDPFVTISCRISKLGISDEALQAWHLERSHYFVVLIRYTNSYKSLDHLIGGQMFPGGSPVMLRVGVSRRYKITVDEAIAAFTQLEDKRRTKKFGPSVDSSPGTSGLGRLFIGRPLEDLLNERLLPLLRYRMAMGFPWGGAEEFFNDHQGQNLTEADAIDAKYWAEDTSNHSSSLPRIVTQDSLTKSSKEQSFPLLAMEFSLRHLVRCTEFCLVCHCKVKEDFEALKPYVCSKPLCLYQYMSLGFGPSIEHEIITQPHVVDLLISFCYGSAHFRKLRYLPTGMALMVPAPGLMERGTSLPFPGLPQPSYGQVRGNDQSPVKPKPTRDYRIYTAKFDYPKMELIFPPGTERVLHNGMWITFQLPGSSEERYHCRVVEVLYPTVKLGSPIVRSFKKVDGAQQPTSDDALQRQMLARNTANVPTPAATPPLTATTDATQSPQDISFALYEVNFDELDSAEKQSSICMLLDTLPSVPQMSDFLRSRGGQETSLRSWPDRFSPASLGLLRWIIASNRSCIIQVDNLDPAAAARHSEERVSGMPDWMQFRFAQGAPDKEQRFVTSVRDKTGNTQHPTMFAWHGSPLHNWHGIVREGLHFEKATHGRAYGNGVYHSLDVSTSLGYSGGYYYGYSGYGGGDPANLGQWPHSQLRISQAIALNEIVNAPSEFVSRSPHLVIAQLDWIQSRYLFVKCNVHGLQIPDITSSQVYEQDPSYTPVGANRENIVIPVTAVSKSRRPSLKSLKIGHKKVKFEDPNVLQGRNDPAIISDDTDVEDVAILFSDTEEKFEAPSTKRSNEKGKAPSELPSTKSAHTSKTDFLPGYLDHKSLPLLEPPSYATSMATRALQRELASTLKVQDTHPAHELGWYLDAELVTNVYQWILELHSFESHLPLAKDMKSKGIRSVVIELRFGKNYPMTPPFVRVIRPRFLGFMQGGGGHVTAGGALCMELLTNSGWSAVSNIESVLLQVRLAMSSTEPKPARLEHGPVRDYQVGEAVDAFIRACHAHGVRIS